MKFNSYTGIIFYTTESEVDYLICFLELNFNEVI